MKIPRRDLSGAGLVLWRRSARMASIVDLVRPKADFDPETIAVLCAALDEAWDRLLQLESECTRWTIARKASRLARKPEHVMFNLLNVRGD
jgi:hypothetical protein